MSTVPWRPAGHQAVIASLSLVGAEKALRFYETAFGGRIFNMHKDPTGSFVVHGTIQLGVGTPGESVVFVSDWNAAWGNKPSDVSMHVYVEDCDAAFKCAVDAGAIAKQPPSDMFWGERSSRVADEWGIVWTLATQKAILTDEEMAAATADFFANMAAAPPQPSEPVVLEAMKEETEEMKSPSGRSKRARKEEVPVAPAEVKETRSRTKRGKD